MMFLSKFEPHQNKLVFSHHREERASESERAVLPLAMLIFPRVCVPVFMSFCVYIFIIHLCVTIYTYGIKEYGRTRQLSIGHTAFLCGGKGFLLAFIAHISSLFQIEFLAQHKNKNARQNQTQKEIFVFVSIDWLVSLSPTHFIRFLFFLFFYHSLAYRLLRNISIVQRPEQIETSEMFAQNAIQNVWLNGELLHQARPDLSQTECTNQRMNGQTNERNIIIMWKTWICEQPADLLRIKRLTCFQSVCLFSWLDWRAG